MESFVHKSYKNLGFFALDGRGIINTINYVQNIKYCVNKDVLDILLDCLEKGLLRSDIIIDFHPSTAELYNLQLKKVYHKVAEILKYNSLCYSHKSILTNALLLKNQSAIYFPTFID